MAALMRYFLVPMESEMREGEMNDGTGGIVTEIIRLSENYPLVLFLEQLTNDGGKIENLQPFFIWTPSTSTRQNFQKSSATAKKYEEVAKCLANNFGGDRAIKLANMITAFAKDAHDLALGHLTRSQIMMAFGMEKSSAFLIKDELKSVLNILNQNPNQEWKELVMKLYGRLREFSNSEFGINHLAQVEQRKRERAEFTKSLFSLKSPSKNAPALEDFVEIRWNSSRGRHVVLTKDVPVGTTLLVEKPFLSGPVDILKLEIGYCHHCAKYGFKPIPCPNCVFVLFCSEKCQEEAQNYHKYECPCFPDLYDLLSWHDDRNKRQWLIAFKLVCFLGPAELYRQFQKENEAKKSASPSDVSNGSKLIAGCDPLTGIFDPSSFLTVRHVQRLIPLSTAVFSSLVHALALTKILASRTDFFQFQFQLHNVSAQPKETETKLLEFQNHVTKILFQQFGSELFNMCKRGEKYHAAISPTVVLFSHSCDPNVIPLTSFHGDGLRIAKVAARDLKAGEELCVGYTPPFYSALKSERQAHLMEVNGFECDCTACSNDWPVMTKELQGFRNVNPVFCCVTPSCSKSTSTSEDVKNTSLVLQKSGKELKCPVCNSIYEEEKLMCEFKKHLKTLEKALDLLEKDEELKGVKDVLAASTFFQQNLQPPSVHQIKCREILEKVLYNSCVDLID